MSVYNVPLWKEAPFLRLLLPFITGILYHYYLGHPAEYYGWMLAVSAFGIFIFSRIPLHRQFVLYWWNGLFITILLLACGGIIGSIRDPFLSAEMAKPMSKQDMICMVTILEPPAERPKTWKTLARLNTLQIGDTFYSVKTDLLLYFRKDSATTVPRNGSRLLIFQPLKKISNPASFKGFDYVRYCALKNIHYRVFLKPGDYEILSGDYSNGLWRFVYRLRERVTATIKRYVPGKIEAGLAMALLIGYKDELDRTLVQSYSNTGVVHVIAISGLHLGLIYAILKWFCRPLSRSVVGKIITALIVLIGLWLFAILAGAGPSVLRSAVMFTFIVAGEFVARQSGVVNNLAASAFFLLFYDPYWLWDLGFILSYSALLGIVIYSKPLYHLFMFRNKMADTCWKMNAVTLSAQILTAPVIIYYFHQFPNLFLLTNFLVIPLSSIVLVGEIILCAIPVFPKMAGLLGEFLALLIRCMNNIVVTVDAIPFANTTHINISFLQLILLYVFILLGSCWLLLRYKRMLMASLFAAIGYFVAGLLKIWS